MQSVHLGVDLADIFWGGMEIVVTLDIKQHLRLLSLVLWNFINLVLGILGFLLEILGFITGISVFILGIFGFMPKILGFMLRI